MIIHFIKDKLIDSLIESNINYVSKNPNAKKLTLGFNQNIMLVL